MRSPIQCAVIVLMVTPIYCAAGDPHSLAEQLQGVSGDVLSDRDAARNSWERSVSLRLKAANAQSSNDWRAIKTRTQWESFRDERIARLRKSLGDIQPLRQPVRVQVTGAIDAGDYTIRRIVYESRPGLNVTANLYTPAGSEGSRPGILLSHSHHSPKSQGELQDMGALWARAGCYVLVPDHVGHGERRQHPFVTASDYPEKFQASRQDYHFRFNTALQLYVAGESLMGWMALDLMRGVDVLLAQPNIDPDRIALLGGVAGGGDPAGVTGALDARIKLVVPFNFGGPQPETRYPLPDDAESTFGYAGGGSWESTRNLHRSASDGFLPWVIVGSVAPRGLIHAHEFAWDRARDPVWKRYEQIFAWYDAADRLDFAHGFGTLRQQEPDASHCGNIGKPHRERIHAYLKQHWGVSAEESKPVKRYSAAELACLSEGKDALRGKPVHELARQQIQMRREAASIADVRTTWKDLLGGVEPTVIRQAEQGKSEAIDGVALERWTLHAEGEHQLPLVLLKPKQRQVKMPVVLVLSQAGKSDLLKHRSSLLALLLKDHAVCLVDLRGIGELRPGDDRGRRSAATSLAASELMLGDTVVGGRLRDARAVLKFLRARGEFDRWIVLGESLSPPNDNRVVLQRPLELDQPQLAEPLGGTLALLVGLFETEPLTIAARGGLIRYASLLESPFVHVPFDAIVPGAAVQGDLPVVAGALPKLHTVRVSGLVDGLNRSADAKQVQSLYGAAAVDNLEDEGLVIWFCEARNAK